MPWVLFCQKVSNLAKARITHEGARLVGKAASTCMAPARRTRQGTPHCIPTDYLEETRTSVSR
jgi:hypothetical protein